MKKAKERKNKQPSTPTNPNGAGRTKGATTATRDVLQKIQFILRRDGTDQDAYSYAGIPSSTFYKRKKGKVKIVEKIVAGKDDMGRPVILDRETTFDKFCDEAERYAGIRARNSMFNQIIGNAEEGIRGDGKLALERMKLRDDRYRPKQENINANINQELSDEDKNFIDEYFKNKGDK